MHCGIFFGLFFGPFQDIAPAQDTRQDVHPFDVWIEAQHSLEMRLFFSDLGRYRERQFGKAYWLTRAIKDDSAIIYLV